MLPVETFHHTPVCPLVTQRCHGDGQCPIGLVYLQTAWATGDTTTQPHLEGAVLAWRDPLEEASVRELEAAGDGHVIPLERPHVWVTKEMELLSF